MDKGTAQAFLAEWNKIKGTVGGDKIRKWYNKNIAFVGSGKWYWCCATIVYCAVHAGVPASVIKHTASSSAMLNFFKAQGRYKSRESGYNPNPADIIFFDYIPDDGMPASHIGIVTKCEGGYVHTMEGNSGNKVDGEVASHKYPLSNSRIRGYGHPDYAVDKVTLKENGAIYQYAYKDIVGKTSKVLKDLKKGAKVTLVTNSDDGWGWCKVKSGDTTGWIMNNHLNTKGLSKFKKYTLNSDTKVKPVEDKKLGKTEVLKKGTKYTLVCIIEKGEYKGKKYITVDGKRFYM